MLSLTWLINPAHHQEVAAETGAAAVHHEFGIFTCAGMPLYWRTRRVHVSSCMSHKGCALHCPFADLSARCTLQQQSPLRMQNAHGSV